MQRRTLLRLVLWSLPALAGGVLALVAGTWLYASSDAGNALILAQVLPRLQPKAGALRVAALHSNLLHDATLDGLELVAPDGHVLVHADHASASLDTLSLLSGSLPIATLDVAGLVVDIPDLTVFGTMWPSDPAAPPWGGLPVDVTVGKVHVDAPAVTVAGWGVTAATLDGGLTARGRQVDVQGVTLDATTMAGPGHLAVTGAWSPERTVVQAADLHIGDAHTLSATFSGALDGARLAWHVPAAHVDPVALAALVPATTGLPLLSPVDAALDLSGTTDTPALAGSLTTLGGSLTLTGDVTPATRAWHATLSTARFASIPVLAGVEPFVAKANLVAAGTGWTWPDALTADADVDLVLAARGETLILRGPAHLDQGVVHVDGVRADVKWAQAVATGDIDVLGHHAELRVAGGRVELGRFHQRGRVAFDGALAADWADRVAVTLKGPLSGNDLAFAGVSVASARGTVDGGWDGRRLIGRTHLDVHDVHYRDRHADQGTVDVGFGDSITFTALLHEGDTVVADTEGRYIAASGRLELDRADVALAEDLRVVSDGPLRLRFAGDGITDAHVDVHLGDAHVVADGGFGVKRADVLTLQASGLDLALLQKLDPQRFAGWSGALDVDAEVRGTLDTPRIRGTATARALVVPGQVDGLDGTVAFTSDGDVVTLDGGVGTGGATLASVKGSFPVHVSRAGGRIDTAGPVDAHFTLSPLDTEAIERLLAGRTFPRAHVQGDVIVTGVMHDPHVELDAAMELPGEGTPGAKVRATIDQGRLTADVRLSVDHEDHALASVRTGVDEAELRRWIDGGPLPGLRGPLSGTVRIDRLPLTTLRRFVAVPRTVDGDVEGTVTLGGTLDRPTVAGTLALRDGRVADVGLSTATVDFGPKDEGYTLDASLAFSDLAEASASRRGRLLAKVRAARPSCATRTGDPAGSLHVSGYVPVGADLVLDRPGLSLDVSGDGFPLALAESFTDQLSETSGCLVLGGRVEGSLRTPDLQLDLDLRDAATVLPAAGVRVQNVTLDARFVDDELIVDALRADTLPGLLTDPLDPQKGSLRGTGSFRLGTDAAVKGHLTLDRAWLLALSDERARVSGDVSLGWSGGVVEAKGRVLLDEGYLHLGERYFSGDRATRLDPDIEVLRPHTAAAPPPATTAEASAFVLHPDLGIDLARHLRVDVAMPLQGSYGDAAKALTTVTVRSDVDGELHVAHVDDDLRVTGEITTEKGRADVLGRPFDLGDGTIAFTGADYTSPILDLHANYHATDGDIAVTISGVPSAPKLAFTSDTYGDDDILAVLVLGAPLSEFDGAASGGAAFGLVSSLLRNELASEGASALRLDTLELDSGSTTVGFSLGRNVTLTTAYHFDVTDPTRENLVDVSLALALPHKVYLELSSGTAGVSKASAYRKWRL